MKTRVFISHFARDIDLTVAHAKRTLSAMDDVFQRAPEPLTVLIVSGGGAGKTSMLAGLWAQAHEIAHATLTKDVDQAFGISMEMGAVAHNPIPCLNVREVSRFRPTPSIREICERFDTRVQQTFEYLVRRAQRALNGLISELLRAFRNTELPPDNIVLVELAWFLYHGVGRPPRLRPQALAGLWESCTGRPSSVPPTPNLL